MSLSGASHESYIPSVPDALQEQEFIPILVVNGEEWGLRELGSVRSTRDAARDLGETFRRNVGRGHVVVLVRNVGPWRMP